MDIGNSNLYLSVIIPAYNEAERITRTLLDIHNYLSGQSYDYEILVLNDGSSDKTAEVVENLKSKVSNLRLVDNKKNHGKGYVVKQGMLEASGDIRLFTDADNSVSIDHFEKIQPYFCVGTGSQEPDIGSRGSDCYEVVIGSRRVKGAEIAVHQSFYKEWLGIGGNLIIRIFAVGGMSDTQVGFKAFSAKAAKDIFSRATISRWGFDFEALAIAKKLRYRIKEIPVRWINDPKSHVKLGSYIKTLFETLKVRKNLWTGKYDRKNHES